jgi:hypothetical protein
MTEFIATIYEWFGYNTDLGNHLRGLDITCTAFIGTDFYLLIFLYMIGINIALFILMYYIINSVRFLTKWSWWLTALLGMAINFGIAMSYPAVQQPCIQLHFTGIDLTLYGIANAFWSLIIFIILTSNPYLRKLSTNCRNTTFWKP